MLFIAGTSAYGTSPACKTLPDLKISKVSVSNPGSNGKVIVRYTIKNTGTAVAKSSTTKLALTDKKGAIYDSVPGLTPGSSVSRTVEYVVPEKGRFEINATADYNNIIAEKNEINNQNSVSFSIGRSF